MRNSRREFLRGQCAQLKDMLESTRQEQQSISFVERQGGDIIDDTLTDGMNQTSVELREKKFGVEKEIQDAIARCRDGAYGVCEGCNKDIPIARLRPLPLAKNCVKCQAEAEKDTRV